jgi:predicted NACHT family NTPase
MIHSNSRYSSSANRAAIGFSSTGAFSHIQILGNRGYNDTSFLSSISETAWQKYGFYNPTPANITYLILSNNDFYDAAHTASISGTPASYIGSTMNY